MSEQLPLGRRLRDWRRSHRYTQREAGIKAAVSISTLSRLERGLVVNVSQRAIDRIEALIDTTNAACVHCGTPNVTIAPVCGGCGAAGWAEAGPAAPDFDADAADMVESAAEGDGWIPPSRAGNLKDSISSLLWEVYQQGERNGGALARMLADEQAAHTEWQAKAERWHTEHTNEARAHEATRQELAAAQTWSEKQHAELRTAYQNIAKWRSLAEQRQSAYDRASATAREAHERRIAIQDGYERTLAWTRRWKACAKGTRRDAKKWYDDLLTEAMYRGIAQRQRDAALTLLRRARDMGSLAPALVDELARLEGGGE